MNRITRLISIIVTLVVMVSGCSTMLTTKSTENVATLLDNQPYQVRVRSGHFIRDRTLYETALLEFGKYLAITEKGPYKGTIEIISTGISDSSFLDASANFTTGSVLGNAWYTGTGYIGLSGSDSTEETDSTAARTVMPEDNTTRIIIKSSQEEPLWTADYKHKSVYTSDNEPKVTKRSMQKIVEKLQEDFPAIGKSTR